MRILRVMWANVPLLVLLALTGCGGGSGMAEVHGTVKVDGQPIKSGAISFYPKDKKGQSTGGDIKDGQYSVRVPVGVMSVQISERKVAYMKKLYNKADSPERPVYKEGLPARYNIQSQLELDVKAGDNPKDWDLKAK